MVRIHLVSGLQAEPLPIETDRAHIKPTEWGLVVYQHKGRTGPRSKHTLYPWPQVRAIIYEEVAD